MRHLLLGSMSAALALVACESTGLEDHYPSSPASVSLSQLATSGIPDIVVNTTSDVADFVGAQSVGDLPGPDEVVSLREAIIAANNTAGPQVIGFNIPTSDPGFDETVFTIRPTSQLPDVTGGQTTIDGSTQATATGNTNPAGPEIVLDGVMAPNAGGLSITSDGNLVHSLVTINFPRQGLGLYGNGNRVTGCFIGVGPNGTTAAGNGLNHEDGLQIGGSNNVIGGPTAALRNIISSNFRSGIALFSPATGNVIQGNHIGPDASGTASVGGGNEDGGIAIFGGSGNLIGGTGPGEGNLISGNRGAEPMDAAGIYIVMGNDNYVQGNFIGTDVSGTMALSNHNGIEIFAGVSGTLVGGELPGAANLVSGNVHNGVDVWGDRNVIRGNKIGTDASGMTAIHNSNNGIEITEDDAINNIVKSNIIAFNDNAGIGVIWGATKNTICRNSIFSNQGLGIDLARAGSQPEGYLDGVTPNDVGDTDIGSNNLMNFPVLTEALATPGRLVVRGMIDTPNPETVTIEFFANPVPTPGADPSGHGEGAVFLGMARPNPVGRILAILPIVMPGTLITATATDADGNTSEFAANIEARSLARD